MNKFSIIIPTYNRANLLDRCLQSLVNQTYKDFEVIVCDDGSKDNSREIYEKYLNNLNIQYLWAENWGGPARPRNKGIAAAKGEWICFLDSDDSWYPNKLEVCKEYINDYDLIYHDLINNDGKKKDNTFLSRDLGHNVFQNLMLNGNCIYNSSVCIRKQSVVGLGGLSEDKKLVAVEDFDLWIRASLNNCRFKYIPLFLGEYWTGGSNISSFGSSELDHERKMNVYNLYLHKLSKKDMYKCKSSLAYSYGFAFLRSKKTKEARIKFKEAFKYGNIKLKIKALCRLIFGIRRLRFWRKH